MSSSITGNGRRRLVTLVTSAIILESSKPQMNSPLSEEFRKKVFGRLVEVQDRGSSVAESRRIVAEQFQVSLEEVRNIEREGIAGQWPPL